MKSGITQTLIVIPLFPIIQAICPKVRYAQYSNKQVLLPTSLRVNNLLEREHLKKLIDIAHTQYREKQQDQTNIV